MKQLALMLSVSALLLLAAGCSEPSVNTISNAGVNATITRINDKRVDTDADLAEDLCLTEIRESQTNDGYMRIQVFLKNTTRSTLEIVYRFNWYDNAGAEVENPDNEMWVRKFIVAGDDVTLTSVAPGKKCRDFKLRVKAID